MLLLIFNIFYLDLSLLRLLTNVAVKKLSLRMLLLRTIRCNQSNSDSDHVETLYVRTAVEQT